MSAVAVGWAIEHSPYEGAAFTVHLMIADTVNDQNDMDFWMSMGRLAAKSRCRRRTAGEVVARMLDDGFLEVIEDHRTDCSGKPSRYRFLRPAGPVIFDGGGRSPSRGGGRSATGGGRSPSRGVDAHRPGGGRSASTNEKELEVQRKRTGPARSPRSGEPPMEPDAERALIRGNSARARELREAMTRTPAAEAG